MKYDIEKMIKLREQGKTYNEIADILKCSQYTIKYHLIPNRKKNQLKYDNNLKINNPLTVKKKRFMIKGTIEQFTLKELNQKLGPNPKCYLTGENIDLSKPDTYSLDHILPISRGGKSSLANLAICKSEINQAKYNLTPKEFIELCKRVVENNYPLLPIASTGQPSLASRHC